MKLKFMTPVMTPVGKGLIFAEAERKPGEMEIKYAVILRRKDYPEDIWHKICPTKGNSKLMFYFVTELSVI